MKCYLGKLVYGTANVVRLRDSWHCDEETKTKTYWLWCLDRLRSTMSHIHFTVTDIFFD